HQCGRHRHDHLRAPDSVRSGPRGGHGGQRSRDSYSQSPQAIEINPLHFNQLLEFPMNLHEFQAKQLFAEYGLPVSKGIAAESVSQAVAAMKEIGGDRWVVKAQVHAGGRGKAGGVKLVSTAEEV